MKMSSVTALSFLCSLFLIIHSACGFDITQILSKYPDFSTFNSYLTQTGLASAINSRQTITVLVVDNANISPLSAKSQDTIKNILSVHVVLDYYDVTKLQQLSTSSALLTTHFQSTGLALGQQGFLNVSHSKANTVTFGSAMPGSTQGSSLVKLVEAQPYNISVLQISSAIIPQGIDGAKTSSPPSKAPPATTTSPPPTAAATAPPTPTTAATAPPTPATAATAPPTPAAAATTPPPQSSKAPASSPPTKAAATPTPSAAPGSAPTPGAPAAADAPAASEEPAETTPAGDKPKAKSAATAIEIGFVVIGTMALSTLYLAASTI